MAKKAQKKPSKKSPTKGTTKAKKASAKSKKAAAPAKKAAAPAKKAAAPKKKAASKSAKAFSVPEFAKMTYLTENGVMQWLQQGLLKGQQDAKGNWKVEASNLEVANVKRLMR